MDNPNKQNTKFKKNCHFKSIWLFGSESAKNVTNYLNGPLAFSISIVCSIQWCSKNDRYMLLQHILVFWHFINCCLKMLSLIWIKSKKPFLSKYLEKNIPIKPHLFASFYYLLVNYLSISGGTGFEPTTQEYCLVTLLLFDPGVYPFCVIGYKNNFI